MAVHKVPQDIEAEDKILGPFSLRQFIYLIIAVACGFVSFALGNIAILLAIIPFPAIALFLVLALPLKKDQPMETYLAALIRFLFVPRIRHWDPDGAEIMIEITNPAIEDDPISRKIRGEEASNRLSLLSDIEDSQGWVTRGEINNTSLNDELLVSVSNTQDILEDSEIANEFNTLLNKSSENTRNEAISRMNEVLKNKDNSTQQIQPQTQVQPQNNIPRNQSISVPNRDNYQSTTPALSQDLAKMRSQYAEALQPVMRSTQPVYQTQNVTPTAEDEAATAALLAQQKSPDYSASQNIHEKVVQPLNLQNISSENKPNPISPESIDNSTQKPETELYNKEPEKSQESQEEPEIREITENDNNVEFDIMEKDNANDFINKELVSDDTEFISNNDEEDSDDDDDDEFEISLH